MAVPPPDTPPVQLGDPDHDATGDYIVKTVLHHYEESPNTRVAMVVARGVVAKFIGGVNSPKLGFIAMRDDGAQLRVASVSRWSSLRDELDSWLADYDTDGTAKYVANVVRLHDDVARLERELAVATRKRNVALARAAKAGYTQYALADLLGVSRTNVNRWTRAARL